MIFLRINNERSKSRPSSVTTKETAESNILNNLVKCSVKVSITLHVNIPSRMN